MRSMRGTLPLGLRARLPVAFLSPRLAHLFENVEEPEARLNLALLRTEDVLLAGTATADDIFGAAPGAGSYRDARIGIAIILHGSSVIYWAAERPREIGGIAQKAIAIALVQYGERCIP